MRNSLNHYSFILHSFLFHPTHFLHSKYTLKYPLHPSPSITLRKDGGGMTSSSFPSSSSSSFITNNGRNNNYDIFISFRGLDTRAGFTGYLASALRANNIKTFTDDVELEKGQVINSALENAIQESRTALIVFSETYASSRYCLQELSLIMKCRAEKGMFVWPVFYRLDPADVGFQRKSYAEAFEKHEQRFEEETLQEWKSALREASKISGWHITYGTVEITVVNDIVKSVSTKLSKLHEDDNYNVQHKRGDELPKSAEDSSAVEKAPEGTPASGGLLVVIIHGAEDVQGKHHTNPFAVVSFGGETRATKTVKKNRYPEWGERFLFTLDKPPINDSLQVRVWSESKFSLLHSLELLGSVAIDLADVVSNKIINKKYDLIHSEHGRIKVELQWRTL